MNRRDLILASLAITAFGGAEVLRPRKRLVLLDKNTTVEAILPRNFGGWEAQNSSDLVGPEQAGRLARSLYSETVSRVYHQAATGAGVMVLAAYGDTQSDLLQLHRPESCYPAVGFTLRRVRSTEVAFPTGAVLPAREVVATTEDRTENIIYWTRMGEALPQTGEQQRMARLQNAIRGFVPDGILVRCSALGDSDTSFKTLNRFIVALVKAVPRDKRAPLVGTELARRIV